MHDGIERDREVHVFFDELVGYAAAEPAVPALRIETQYMLAVFFGFADPQFADHGAFRKDFLHSTGLLTLSSIKALLIASSQTAHRQEYKARYIKL
jgi:hypothetical protein